MTLSPNSIFSNLRVLLFTNKSTKQTLFKNTFWLMAAEAIAKFLLFLITISVVRYLGVVNYGKYSFAFAFTALFSVIVDFGLNTLATRDIARDPKLVRKYLANILGLKTILGGITLLFIVISIQLLGKSTDVKFLVYLAGFYTVIQSFVLFFPAVFQGLEKMEYFFFSRVLTNVILLASIFLILFYKLPIHMIIVGYILTATVTVILVSVFTKRKVTDFSIEFDFIFWKKIIDRSWPFFATLLCYTVYLNIDSTLISIFRTYREVGLYQAAYKLLYVFQTLNIVHSAMFPRMSYLVSHKLVSAWRRLMQTTIIASLVILLPAGILVYLFNTQIVNLIYGKSFVQAAMPFTILIWSSIIGFFAAFGMNTLVVANRQRTVFYITLLGTAANVISNLLLIPRYGILGAAVSLFISETIILITVLSKVRYVKKYVQMS